MTRKDSCLVSAETAASRIKASRQPRRVTIRVSAVLSIPPIHRIITRKSIKMKAFSQYDGEIAAFRHSPNITFQPHF
jgi:hypothetical protein